MMTLGTRTILDGRNLSEADTANPSMEAFISCLDDITEDVDKLDTHEVYSGD